MFLYGFSHLVLAGALLAPATPPVRGPSAPDDCEALRASATDAGDKWPVSHVQDKVTVGKLGDKEVVKQRSSPGQWEDVPRGPFLANPQAEYYVSAEGKLHRLKIPAASPAGGRSELDGSSGNTSGAPPPGPSAEVALEQCKQRDELLNQDYKERLKRRSICVRIGDGLQPELVYLPEGVREHVLAPNTALQVVVVSAPGVTVEIKLGGVRGLYSPGSHGFTGNAGGGSLEVRSMSFAPRRPDSDADLKIKASHGQRSEEETFELFVEKSYSGALRVGLGVLGGPTVDHDYKAVRVDSSAQNEIVAVTGGRAEFELVAGYAPFVFDGKKGRAYDSTRLCQRACGFAPYIGLGVLNVSAPTGLEFLKSVHLGLEWEPQRNVSIALTAIARRVTELRPGYAVGSPIVGTDVPTRERLAFGVGLVINLTPEFLRFAIRGSSSLLRGSKE